MSSNAITHIVLTDDDGSGTTGTILNNSVFDAVQDAVDAGLQQVFQTKSGNYTVLVTDDVVRCTVAITLTLYAAAGNSGRRLEVINDSTGDVTLDGNASETINGAVTYTVKAGARVTIRCNGSNWYTATDTPIGVHDIWVPATAMRPLTSGGCGWHESIQVSNGGYAGLPFDPVSTEWATWSVRMPASWNEGTITFEPVWCNTAGGSGTVGFYVYGRAFSDGDSMSWSIGAAGGSLDTAQAANTLAVGPSSAAWTVDGSPAAGDLVNFGVVRDPSADTYGSDAYLLGVVIHLTTNAADDA